MNREEREFSLGSLERWREVDAMQKRLRRENASRMSLADAITALDMSFRSAIFRLEKRKTSGMVEFYKKFGLVK